MRVVAVLAAFTVSACSVSTGEPASTRSALEEIALWIETANDAGASAQQIAILERAQDRSGVVTIADVNEAYQETLRCYDQSGLEYSTGRSETTTGSRVWVPTANIALPQDGTEEEWDRIAGLAEECADLHHIWVASAYANQPSSRESQEAVWTSRTVIECLEARGYDFPDDVSADEVRQAESDDFMRHQSDSAYSGRCVPNQG